MLHPVSSNALLRIAHSQYSLLPLRASISSAHYRHAHNTFRHTSPPSRRLHDHPAAHNPRDQQASSPPPISTVNDAEIAHFSRLSALWWDERGEFALLHKMNPHRVRFIREKVLEVQRDERPYFGLGAATATLPLESSRVLEGMDVLDVGCGGGILSESLARLGANTVAIDASAENIGIATRHAEQDPGLAALSFRHAPAEVLVQETKRFDVVCSMEVIEHVDNPAAFLRSCAELVKPGGHLFLSTIARTPLSYFLTILAAEKVLRLVEPGTHTFSKYVNPEELVGFFAKPLTPGTRPWISRTYDHGLPTRVEGELRGLIYVPWQGDWVLAPRSTTPWSTQANYVFWVRRPRIIDA